ncbi:MAG: FAD-binding protein [Ferruginibacter sp.]|nr:FAD-binding protein [Ferruginibacter sp.]
MQKKIVLRLSPSSALEDSKILKEISSHLGVKQSSVNGFHIIKRSVDARSKNILINLTVNCFIDEPFQQRPSLDFSFKDVHSSEQSVIIIGAGPAGLFASLKLIEAGIKPIVLERGKDVKSRRRDLAALNKQGIVNPESNYCFGEGGAGTYSDGKLYTRSNKRGDINRILQLFVKFGAQENILFDAHPHIGTNKLPQIITAMRQWIIQCGGEIHFEKKLISIKSNGNQIVNIHTGHGEAMKADAYILATGHSARDVFELLHQQKILIEAKPFALGVRIEHPQTLIDQIQYHCDLRSESLPPASYSLVNQINDHGVFSFCMCPGGIIAPASTQPGELVVNGWSPSKRNNPFANSGMVVEIKKEDVLQSMPHLKSNPDHPLMFMYFQQMIKRKAFEYGGGKMVAPAQRMVDFTDKKTSSSLPENSYLPGLKSVSLTEILPGFVHSALAGSFKAFGKKLKGYYTNDAVVVATESRTSSPVRIPRDANTLAHPQLHNLYPCGEGAGYAGGIVSAAMDGENVAASIINKIFSNS